MEEAPEGPSVCRICHDVCTPVDSDAPCKCTGSLQYVHRACLIAWLNRRQPRDLQTWVRCEICKQRYKPSVFQGTAMWETSVLMELTTFLTSQGGGLVSRSAEAMQIYEQLTEVQSLNGYPSIQPQVQQGLSDLLAWQTPLEQTVASMSQSLQQLQQRLNTVPAVSSWQSFSQSLGPQSDPDPASTTASQATAPQIAGVPRVGNARPQGRIRPLQSQGMLLEWQRWEKRHDAAVQKVFEWLVRTPQSLPSLVLQVAGLCCYVRWKVEVAIVDWKSYSAWYERLTRLPQLINWAKAFIRKQPLPSIAGPATTRKSRRSQMFGVVAPFYIAVGAGQVLRLPKLLSIPWFYALILRQLVVEVKAGVRTITPLWRLLGRLRVWRFLEPLGRLARAVYQLA